MAFLVEKKQTVPGGFLNTSRDDDDSQVSMIIQAILSTFV